MSSVNSTSGTPSTSNHYWGLSSGLDVDSIVEGLCSDVQEQIDRVKAEEQKLEWKQTAYRDVISALEQFEKSYLLSGSSTSMALSNAYTTYNVTSSNTALLTAKADSRATGQSQTVRVIQSAVSASLTSKSAVTGNVNLLENGNISGGLLNSLKGKSFNLTVGDVTQTIKFTEDEIGSVTSVDDFVSLLNGKLGDAFQVEDFSTSEARRIPLVQASVTAVDGNTAYLTFSVAAGYDSKSFSLTSAETDDALALLGFNDGASNHISSDATLGKILPGAFESDEWHLYVNINGVAVDLGTSDTKLSEALSAINKSGAGVRATYDSALGQISIISKTSGSKGSVVLSDSPVEAGGEDTAASIDCSRTTEFFKALNIAETSSTNQRDAIVSINGKIFYEPSNTFTINGVTYSINSTVDKGDGTADTSGAYTAALSFIQDTANLENKIKDFISAYNNLVDKISNYINTKPDKDYFPLTDAQKEKMSQSEIEKWNDKADDGILYGDSTLQGILDSMRSALYKSVTLDDGSKISLYDIGITTSNDYTQYGKLEIKDADLSKFRDALLTRTSDIAQLFTKSASISFLAAHDDSEKMARRTNEEGLVDRLDDILKGAIGHVGDYYGSLLTIAGTSTTCTYTNSIYKELQDKEDQLKELKNRLKEKQESLYDKFVTLETYMTQANAQSSIIASMLGSKQ